MSNFHIYIPTVGRVNSQVTLNRVIPPPLRKHTSLVVAPHELKEHKKHDINLISCAIQGKFGVAPVRDWIIDYAHKKGHRYIVMMDDDVVLQRRKDDGSGRILNTDDFNDRLKAIQWLFDTLKFDGYVHCGWGVRFLNWDNKTDPHLDNTRAVHIHGYDTKVLKELKVKFTPKSMPEKFPMEDFHMTLQLLERGYPNRVSLEWRSSPAPSNAPGGWSLIRTQAIQTQAAKALAAEHPLHVKTREKKSGMGAGAEGPPMLDVKVAWQKAFKYGQQLRLNLKGKR